MLNSKTVFVVGAGASKEVNLPVGRGLRRIIYDKLDFRTNKFGVRDPKYGDEKVYDWIRRYRRNTANNYLAACRRICDGILLSESIDDFLDVHRNDKEMEECGKLAIAIAILEAEKSSLLAYDTQNIYNSMNFPPLENTWYMGFFQLLHQGLSKDDRGRIFNNATLIIFNYDRCIEHFLVHALAAHYQITKDDALDLTRQVSIFHPYGSVGNYLSSTENQVPFGVAEISDLDRITKNIRTYTEQITDEASLSQLRAAVKDARVVVFLGNAFHANNMKLITPEVAPEVQKDIYFTRAGVSNGDLQVVMKQLMRLRDTVKYEPVPPHFFHFTDTCYKLFEEFRMSLRE